MTEPPRTPRRGRETAGVLALALFTLLAPQLAMHAPDAITDPTASRDRPPGATLIAIELRDGTTLLADRVTARNNGRIEILRSGLAQEFERQDLAPRPPEPRRFVLGTDALGRDLLARLLHGWRNSLAIAITAALFSLLAGTAVGLAVAYAGGWIDRWTMRFVDILRSLPKLFLLLAVAATREPGPVLLVLLLAMVSWMSIARLVRAEARALRRAEFIAAAHASGCSPTHILVQHYLPHLRATLMTLGLVQLSGLVLLEAALSFVGAGLAPPTPSLGGLVAEASLRGSVTWWMVLFPGLAIALASLACRWVGIRLSGAGSGAGH